MMRDVCEILSIGTVYQPDTCAIEKDPLVQTDFYFMF